MRMRRASPLRVPQASMHMKQLAMLMRPFTERGVRYAIVGGFAVAIYAPERVPHDLDIVVGPGRRNARRSAAALFEVQTRYVRSDAGPVTTPGKLNQGDHLAVHTTLGILHVIDAHLPRSVDRASLVRRRQSIRVGEQRLWVASLEDLVHLKRATGRPQDMQDVARLTRLT